MICDVVMSDQDKQHGVQDPWVQNIIIKMGEVKIRIMTFLLRRVLSTQKGPITAT